MLVVVARLVALVGAVATVVTPPAPVAASGLTSVSAGAYRTCAITPYGTGIRHVDPVGTCALISIRHDEQPLSLS
jgi:hypothetical protein